MSADGDLLDDEPFPPVSYGEWRQRVERELGEADFAAELVSELPGGLEVEPLYAERPWVDGDDPSGVPGTVPFVRGARSPPEAGAWLRCARCEVPRGAGPERIDAACEALHEDLAGGCDAALLALPSTESLDAVVGAAVEGSEGGPALFLQDLGAGPEVAIALLDRAARLDPGALRIAGLGLDPLAALMVVGGGGELLEDAAERLRGLVERCRAEHPGAQSLAVSAIPVHEAGGGPAQELGWALASLAHSLRLCEREGIDPGGAASSVELRIALERDPFLAIAKLRALRGLWTRWLAACGVDPVPAPFVHAATSRRSLTRRGARLNLVRVAGQALAAVAGGADAISVAPWDDGATATGRRLARNTHTILAEEAHLGRAADPAGGSYYLEHLTEALARDGWQEMQRIEAAGDGAADHLLSGRLQAELARAWERRAEAIRAGDLPIVGVNVFPDPDRPDLPARGETESPDAAVPLARHRDEEAAGDAE